MDLEYIPKNFRNSRGCYDLHAKSNGNNFQLSIEESKKDKKERCLKTRYLVVYMAFMGEFYHYFHRVTMSVAIVAMVNNSAIINETHFPTTQSCMNLIENNSTKQISESATGEFQWSPELQGYILGTSFISFVITIPFLSKCAEIYGGKNTMLCCVFFPSLFLFLTPFAARLNVYVLIAVQFLRGMCEGGIFPATGVLVANWCPKHERGCSYTTALCGVSFGCVVGSYFTGVLCESSILGGWPFAFYVNGSVGFIVSIIIFFFLYDNPSVHPRISPAELDYILSNQENILTEKRPKTPWKSLFTSVPVHALSYAYFGQFWATSHFLTVNPTFLKTILHYSVEQGGFFNALPFLLQILTSQIGGILSTILSEKKCLSTNNARKFWTFLSCFGYSACVLGIYFAGCNRALTIVLSIAALSFVGFSFAGCWVVSADMSPTFAGSINAIACPVGGLSFFLLPVTVGYLTNDMQTIEQWQRIFFICIAIVLSSGVIFCIFGSAEIQPWNEVPEDDSEKVNKKTDVVRMKKF